MTLYNIYTEMELISEMHLFILRVCLTQTEENIYMFRRESEGILWFTREGEKF